MGYSICGLIIRQAKEPVCAEQKLSFVRLGCGVSLIPLDHNHILLTDGEDTQPAEVANFSPPSWLSEIAGHFTKSAYIEAEFFGGDGMQASMVTEKDSVVFGPEIRSHAINSALRQMGIGDAGTSVSFSGLSFDLGSAGKDPFDLVDLGRHRSVAAWLQESADQAAATKTRTRSD